MRTLDSWLTGGFGKLAPWTLLHIVRIDGRRWVIEGFRDKDYRSGERSKLACRYLGLIRPLFRPRKSATFPPHLARTRPRHHEALRL